MSHGARPVVLHAFRRLGMGATDDAVAGEDYGVGLGVLEQLFAELPANGIFPDFTLDDETPAYAVNPLGDLLAAELGPIYERPVPVDRWASMIRLRLAIQRHAATPPTDEDREPGPYF